MMTQAIDRGMFAILILAVVAMRGSSQSPGAVPIPTPKEFTVQGESPDLAQSAPSEPAVDLTTETVLSVVATSDAALAPARAFASDLFALAGKRSNVTRKSGAEKGDVAFVVDPTLAEEEYVIDTVTKLELRGGSATALHWAGVTWVQSVHFAVPLMGYMADFSRVTPAGIVDTPPRGSGELALWPPRTHRTFALPKISVRDFPAFPYRGLLVDVARKPHSIDSLKELIELCRFWKIRYLQLHLSDDQSFTFPSTAYPKLATPGHSYTLDELRDLEQFATDHGIVIIPEIEMPGHGAAMIRAMPDLFRLSEKHHATINFASKDVRAALATLIGEVCAVFKSSPYFHIGCDEVDDAHAHEHADFRDAFERLGVDNAHEVYRDFIGAMNDVVKKNGKQTIVWEGFARHGKIAIPKDVIVMEFESAYNLPQDVIADGYRMINATWTPLYVVNKRAWPVADVLDWNPRKFGHFVPGFPAYGGIEVPKSPLILGGQMCSWEQSEEIEFESLRARLAAMSERLWTGREEKPTADEKRDFTAKLAEKLQVLERFRSPDAATTRPTEFVALDSFDGRRGDFGFQGGWTDPEFGSTGILDAKNGYREADRVLAERLDRRTGPEFWLALTSELSGPLTEKGNVYRGFSPLNGGQHFFLGFLSERGGGKILSFERDVSSGVDFTPGETTILARITFRTASYAIRAWAKPGDGKSIDIEKDAPFIKDHVIGRPSISKLMFNADRDPGKVWRMRRLAIGRTKEAALGIEPAASQPTREKPPMTAVERLLADETKLAACAPIVFFGDSITEAGGYIDMLRALIADRRPGEEIDLINAGISGHKVPDLLARFDRDVAAKKPKTVIIYIGVNDVWHEALNGNGTPPKEFADGLALLIKKTKDIGAVPILLTLAVVGERTDGKNPLDKKLDEYAAITLRVAKENGVVARDLRKAFMDHLRIHNKDQRSEGILTNDGVHMLPAGNEAILEETAAGILESLR